MPIKGKEDHDREMAAKARATRPADLTGFDLPERMSMEDREHFARGLSALRAGEFYLAHDLWEEAWHGYRPSDRRFLQGLIHVVVGSYHVECGNGRGAFNQLGKAMAKLAPYEPRYWGIDVTELVKRVERLRAVPVDAPDVGEHLDRIKSGL